MDARSIRGMAVVTLAEARRVGRVTDVAFAPDPMRAVALRLEGETGVAAVPFERLREIGSDAITADSVDAIDGVGGGRIDMHLPGLDAIAELKVVDDHGTLLGRVTTIELDPADGHVTSLEVRRGDVLGIGGERTTIPAERIRNVGDEVLTVRAIA